MLSHGAILSIDLEGVYRNVDLRRRECFYGERLGNRVRRSKSAEKKEERRAKSPGKLGIFAPLFSLFFFWCSSFFLFSVSVSEREGDRTNEGALYTKKVLLDSRIKANEWSPRGIFLLDVAPC